MEQIKTASFPESGARIIKYALGEIDALFDANSEIGVKDVLSLLQSVCAQVFAVSLASCDIEISSDEYREALAGMLKCFAHINFELSENERAIDMLVKLVSEMANKKG